MKDQLYLVEPDIQWEGWDEEDGDIQIYWIYLHP